MAALSPVARMRAHLKEDEGDFDARLVLADALDDAGEEDAATFQRLLVEFCRFAQGVMDAQKAFLAVPTVFASEFRVWVRVWTAAYHSSFGTEKRLYAWVRKADGAVFRGGWKKSEGPVRFHLYDGPEKYGSHVGAFGLAYLR